MASWMCVWRVRGRFGLTVRSVTGTMTAAVWLAVASVASAQSVKSTDMPGGWMFEVHGGGFGELISNNINLGGAGGGAAFPASTPFGTDVTSRAVTSWTFGDGPALFADFWRANRGPDVPAIAPLDSVMRSRATTSTPARAVGARFSRNLTRGFAAEISVDRGGRRSSLSPDAVSAIEATRASYTTAFESLLSTTGALNPGALVDPGRVTATTATTPETSDTQTVVSGSAVLSLVRATRVGVHLVIGGGVIMNEGSTTDVQLQGRYQFQLGTSAVDESETVTLHFTEKKRVPVAVLGLGTTVRVAGNSGVRVDARVLASRNSSTTSVDSTSRVTELSRVLALGRNAPSLTFGGNQTSRSSLTGEPLNGLATYSGRGLDLRPQFTVGYYVRF